MADRLGKTAAVLGAGIGGLAAAAALARFFDRVLVLERDELPDGATHRSGTPQARHTHALLPGGELALDALVPGFSQDLLAAGAVPMRAGWDVLVERPGFDPFPRRDLGWNAKGASRVLVESVLRERVRAFPNVQWLTRCRVSELRAESGRVCGVAYSPASGPSISQDVDLAVDATGRGQATFDLLDALGQPSPAETSIGVDFRYASAVFERSPADNADWLGVTHLPKAPTETRGAILLPMERGLCTVSLGTRFGEAPPNNRAEFMDHLKSLRLPTLHDVVADARMVGDMAHFAFPASVRRHFERLDHFPGGLVPIGDAVCRFNPVYGQGMSVAAQQANLLARMLGDSNETEIRSGALALRFFSQLQSIIDTPWDMAALPDLIYPATRGERPANFEGALRFMQGLLRLAANDASVHGLMMQVQHLLKPNKVFREPELVERVMRAAA